MRPRPPPTISRTRPPQKRILPSTLNACLPLARMSRKPFDCIHFSVGNDSWMRTEARSPSVWYSVNKARSSKNFSDV